MNVWSDSAHSRRKPSEQAVSIARKTRRRPTTGRAGLNGCAPRSTHGKLEPRFSGLRSSVFDANAPSRVESTFHELSGLAQTKRFNVLARPLGRRRGANVLPGMLEIRSRVPITAFADLHELTV